MIGGTVLQVGVAEDRVWVNCVEDRESSDQECAIYLVRNEKSERIRPGDALWWQGGSAMWTPYVNRSFHRQRLGITEPQKGGIDYDIRIPRIGCSGVNKPEDLKL